MILLLHSLLLIDFFTSFWKSCYETHFSSSNVTKYSFLTVFSILEMHSLSLNIYETFPAFCAFLCAFCSMCRTKSEAQFIARHDFSTGPKGFHFEVLKMAFKCSFSFVTKRKPLRLSVLHFFSVLLGLNTWTWVIHHNTHAAHGSSAKMKSVHYNTLGLRFLFFFAVVCEDKRVKKSQKKTWRNCRTESRTQSSESSSFTRKLYFEDQFFMDRSKPHLLGD